MSKYRVSLGARGGLKTVGIVVTVLLMLVVAAVFMVRRAYVGQLKPVSSDQRVELVTIPTGSTVSQIADILYEKKLIRSDWAFEWYVRSHEVRDKLQAGTYALRPSEGIPAIVTSLTQGKIALDLVTVLPGKRLDEVRQDLINYGFSPDVVDQALEPGQYRNHKALIDKPATASLEGYLYPESFQRTAETTVNTIISQSLDEMAKRLTPEVRAGIIKQGLTPHEGVILASIVEQEVSNPVEKSQVAQVFLRRLRENKALESDATADYGAVLAGQPVSLRYDSAYNTYLHKGLTPGPISNVTDSSLQAVANPASTDWLFFVSGDDGITYFSKTLDEHKALTEKHCKKLCNSSN